MQIVPVLKGRRLFGESKRSVRAQDAAPFSTGCLPFFGGLLTLDSVLGCTNALILRMSNLSISVFFLIAPAFGVIIVAMVKSKLIQICLGLYLSFSVV